MDSLAQDLLEQRSALLEALARNGAMLASVGVDVADPAELPPGACVAPVSIAIAQKPVDGPCLPLSFAYRGETFPGVPKMAYRLLAFLWRRRNRASDAADLAGPVFQDVALDPEDHQVARLRTEANSFFRLAGLPFSVRAVDRQVWIEGVPEILRVK